MTARCPSCTTPRRDPRVPCADDIKFEVVKRAVSWFSERYKVVDVDGARVSTFEEDGRNVGWGLVRASNTGPVLVHALRVADTPKLLGEIKDLVEGRLRLIIADVSDPEKTRVSRFNFLRNRRGIRPRRATVFRDGGYSHEAHQGLSLGFAGSGFVAGRRDAQHSLGAGLARRRSRRRAAAHASGGWHGAAVTRPAVVPHVAVGARGRYAWPPCLRRAPWFRGASRLHRTPGSRCGCRSTSRRALGAGAAATRVWFGVATVSPYAGWPIWMPGAWAWDGNQWVWQDGYWAPPTY